MICVLKHKKSGKYVTHAIGKIMPGGGFRPHQWDGNAHKVQFRLTSDILSARQIEDPNMEMVLAFGLEPVPIKLKKAELSQDYRIIEHEA